MSELKITSNALTRYQLGDFDKGGSRLRHLHQGEVVFFIISSGGMDKSRA